MTTSIIIHGHFYQPPRENPWTGAIERDPKVRPYHDWNDRIHHECYRTNAFARIVDGYSRVERILNNFARMSFNFGPTLMSWMETADPVAYRRILEADRTSVLEHGGHGNAIAQGYNHAILPLCNERDRLTQIRWGMADFRHRFGRDAESLWLPETACNDATLGALIDAGLAYVILSPYQALRVRAMGTQTWTDVSSGSVDPGVPYKYFHRDGSGRSLAIFFYDGPIARSIAFEGVLASSQALVNRLLSGHGGPGRVIHVATDGESYGHHFRLGELTLAHALAVEGPARGVVFTNYGEFLQQHSPAMEAEIQPGPGGEGTAWSCAHGVGRWYRDCGCNTDAREGWNQAWRGPLRRALDVVRDEAARQFEDITGELLDDPWSARNDYVELILDRKKPRDEWLAVRATRARRESDRVRAMQYLEMQRDAQLMYTSCGWFFSEISGIEAVQVMKYAGRVLDLMEELGLPAPRTRFLEVLGEARSNLPEMGNGADVYRKFVEPLRVSPRRIAAHLAISSLVEEGDESAATAGCEFRRTSFQKHHHGRLTLATSRLEMRDTITGQTHDFAFAAIHLGGVDFHCVLKEFPGVLRFEAAVARLWGSFRTASLPMILRIAQDEMGPEEYGLESLLPDGRERVSELVLGGVVANFVEQYVRLYETNLRALEMLQEAGFELPKELRAAAEFALGSRFMQEIRAAHRSPDPAAYQTAIAIADEALQRGYEIDSSTASEVLGEMIANAVTAAMRDGAVRRMETALALVDLARRLRADAHLNRAQEIFFEALETRDGWPLETAKLAKALGFAASVYRKGAAGWSAMPESLRG